MAEIVRSITSIDASFSYPMRELRDKSQREVYEVVGDHLDQQITEEGEKILPGAFLVRLTNGVEVAFEFGVVKAPEEYSKDIVFININLLMLACTSRHG